MQGRPPNMQGMPPNMQGMPPNMQGMPPYMQGMPPNVQGMPRNVQGMPPTENPPWRGNIPTGKHADQAAQADAYVHPQGAKVGRRLLQFEDDPNVARMNQGQGQPWQNGGLNGAFQGNKIPPQAVGGGQQFPPNQGFPPYGMGGMGPPPSHTGVPIENPIDGANLLTLPDAFNLWIINDKAHRETELHRQVLKDREETLKQAVDDPHLREVLQESQHVSVGYNLTSMDKHGPCPTLLHCVGYQACLFRFSNEFCLRDPYPGRDLCYLSRFPDCLVKT